MSTSIKWIVGVLIVVGLGVALWKSGIMTTAPATAPTDSNAAAVQQPAASTGLPTSQSDTSDAALAKDSAAIDAQMSAFAQDSAAVSQSMSDKPISQSY